MKIIEGHNIPIYSWCNELKEKALEQAINLANHPKAVEHVSLMPDCHMGYGMPIGGVVAVKDVVIPNCTGMDIGCGMSFIQTNILYDVIKDVTTAGGKKSLLQTIIDTWSRKIPVGFSHHRSKQRSLLLDNPPENVSDIPVIKENLEKAKYQLGTLGSGNHYCEVQLDEHNNICIMLHSGSRNFGYKIADYYNKIAIETTPEIDPKWELNYLPLDSKDGNDYMLAMNFALDFAKANREHMMEKAKSILLNLIKKHTGHTGIELKDEINIHHNFAAIETHFGKDVMIHRKGATQAFKEQLGIIPGSMGTSSYIVKGKGNPDSFKSCSHGAGRLMGRNQFNKTHTLEECEKAMEGIIHSEWGKDRKGKTDLSESPQAYKDIDQVIKNQNDLVDVVIKLKPIAVLKG